MPAQERAAGWGTVAALILACLVFSVLHPALLIAVPLALLLLALPRGRPLIVVVGALLLGVSLLGGSDPLANVERGWSLSVGAWFLVAVIMLPRVQFLGRGLVAVSAALGTAGAILALRSGTMGALDERIAGRLREAASVAASSFRGAPWLEGSVTLEDALRRVADVQSLLAPALLALGSLAGLAVAWWMYNRLTVQDPAPLRPLREFRFPDALAWVLVLALLLLLLPWGEPQRVGTNLLAFMGALYALRGAAVLLVLSGAPGPFSLLLMGIVTVLLLPLVMSATALVGLTDTWLDLRTRHNASPDANG